MSTCKICDDIWARLSDPTAEQEVNFGHLDEAVEVACSRHVPLVKAFREYSSTRESFSNGAADAGLTKGYAGHSVTLTQSISKLGLVWHLLLVNRPEVAGHPGTGRILDPDWIDIETVKYWKQSCLSKHGGKCENPMKIPATSPAWLVDVEQRCVVPGAGCGSYIALSYRWGDASGYRLSEESLEEISTPGALSAPDVIDKVPLVIRNAIDFAEILGERYLWVDALCILQGSHASTAEQLRIMGVIYANATITIVAADGDASDGLLGIKGVSKSRQFKQTVIPFGDEKIIVRNTGIFSMDSGTPYYDRAWPYQELRMSARKLFFNKKEVHFQCQESVWHEELTLNTEVDKYIDPRLKVILAGFPDMSSLSHAVSRYNERELTYDEDAAPGIAGLLAVLSRSFKGGFLYGCPEMFFDRALGWKPYWPHTNLSRRQPSNRPISGRVSDAALPSWSWLGWQGMIGWGYGEVSRINPRVYHEEETVPITEWYTSEAPSGGIRRRIRSTWFEERDAYKDISKALPDGWTRLDTSAVESFRGEPQIYPDNCGKFVFRHRDFPDEDSALWHYPFPVPNINAQTPFEVPEQTAYLFCKTQQASVWSERRDYARHPNGGHVLKLRNERNGEEIGSLHLQTDEQLAQWPKVEFEEDAVDGRNIELVAIYRSVKYHKTFNEDLKRYDHPIHRKESYAVLWLLWEDQIAHRLACGEVKRDSWEALQRVDIDLTLG